MTSRLESEKSFFNNFTNPHLSLAEFQMRFESAIELQRYNQLQAGNETSSSKPQLKSIKVLEKHVGDIYTYANFYKFQDGFWAACMDCEVEYKQEIQGGLVKMIIDYN